MAGKETKLKNDKTIARWIYHYRIPLHYVQSPYFQQALDAIGIIGPGYKGPSYYDMRCPLLRDCKEECQLLVEKYLRNWEKHGCTIMADGWSNIRSRTLINFLVYFLIGISFVRSIDASDIVKDAHNLFNLFSEVVEWVGSSNVVHMVTDNAANYVAVRRLLHEKYERIYWSLCTTHCLNLVLKDITRMLIGEMMMDLGFRSDYDL